MEELNNLVEVELGRHVWDFKKGELVGSSTGTGEGTAPAETTKERESLRGSNHQLIPVQAEAKEIEKVPAGLV